jgi:hypothetical protein
VSIASASTAGLNQGFAVTVNNAGKGSVTVTPSGCTINGSATFVVPQNTGCTIYSDGTNFQIELYSGSNLFFFFPNADQTGVKVGNLALGAQSGSPLYNTAIGNSALGALTTGQQNTAVGNQAGRAITITNYNTFIGFQAGNTLGAASCTGVGVSALKSCANANNTAVGFLAGQNISSGQDNLVLGANAGSNATSGNSNILIGSGVDNLVAGLHKGVRVGPIIVDGNKPTINSGFGSAPSVPLGTSNAAFTVNVGTGGSASSGVIGFTHNAPNGWAVDATNLTSSASLEVVATPSGTNMVTLTSYSRTTGVLTPFNAGDIIVCKALAY